MTISAEMWGHETRREGEAMCWGFDAIRQPARMYVVMLIIIALTVPFLVRYYDTEKTD